GGIQIQSTIDAAIQRLGSLAGAKPVAIVAVFPAHFPLLAGDETTLREILAGLISHTILNTKRDEIRVRAQLTPVGMLPIPASKEPQDFERSAGPWALISISDQEGAFANLFADDQHASEAAAQELMPSFEKCEALIQSLGGAIWTEYYEAMARSIWVAIPLMATAQANTDISQVRKAVGTHLPEENSAGKSILLFAEDDTLSELLSVEFVSAGYRVIVCQEAAEVLSIAKGDPPDLLILDLQAREPTAFDLARILKQHAKLARIPVLFLTAIPDPKLGLRMDTAGFLIRSEGTGAMLATVHAALSARVAPSARVLVVEANDGLREQMIVHIQALGYPVVEAGSAEEAVALTERTRFGVILANAKLAQARDYWLIRQLKSISPETDIYVLDELLSDEDGRAAVQRGASGFGDTGRLPDLLKKMGHDREGDSSLS
ncbi:MAG: response regulator, partial [Anaerolineales bacterium]